MNITQNEIDAIEDAGMLDGNPVKMIKTKGGFWIAVGRPKSKLKEEALAAGSHPAIVKFNIEKQYPNFQPAMMKSEFVSDSSVVDKHSHFLPDSLRKSGHDLYSIQDGPSIDFHITKHNMNLSTVHGDIVNDMIVINKLEIPKQFSKAVAGAVVEKSFDCKIERIKLKK